MLSLLGREQNRKGTLDLDPAGQKRPSIESRRRVPLAGVVNTGGTWHVHVPKVGLRCLVLANYPPGAYCFDFALVAVRAKYLPYPLSLKYLLPKAFDVPYPRA